MAQILECGPDYRMSLLWIPLPAEGIDFSLKENREKFGNHINTAFTQLEASLETQGFARSDWSYVSHATVNLGDDLLVTVLAKIHAESV